MSGRNAAPEITDVLRKPKTLADIKRRMLKIVDELNAMSGRARDKERAPQARSAADLLTDAVACELWRL